MGDNEINFCSNIDDYRPIQSTLLTRFTSTDCSELWRTTNQDYGAFYYRSPPQYCVPDNLKSKIYRRHNRFQDWLTYQTKCQNFAPSFRMNCSNNNNNNNNNQNIFPSNRNQTIRITHRKRFLPKCSDNQFNKNIFSPCGEAGLITEYIVKKVLNQLQHLIQSDEYQDVIECTQILVSEILAEQPSSCINEIIDRVINIMLTSPDNIQLDCPKRCISNTSSCPTPELPLNTTVTTSGPLNNCSSDIFKNLTNIENAISKLSNQS